VATVRDLINAAMMDIGAIAAGEAASSSEQTDVLNALNNLLDSYSNEKMVIYSKTIETFPLIGGQQTYTMGVGGTFNTARSQLIESAGIFVPGVGSNPGVEIPIDIITVDEWAAIQVKSTTSPIPLRLYNDNANPLCNLNFWPVPTGGNSVMLYSWKPLTDFANVSVTLALPPGYNRFLQKGLAIEICPMFGKSASPELVKTYSEAKSNVKRSNKYPKYLGMDASLLGPRSGFNWLTGETV
jgi:hypothetical protein